MPALLSLLRSGEAHALWRGEPAAREPEVREPRAAPWPSAVPRAALRAAPDDGRHLERTPDPPPSLDRLIELHRQGQWRAVVVEAQRLRRDGEARGCEWEIARRAVEAQLHRWRFDRAAEWAAFAAKGASERDAEAARLLVAWVEWERGDPQRAAISPRRAELDDREPPPSGDSIEPLLLWSRLEMEHRSGAVIARLAAALRDRSRTLSIDRGRLWLELGRARRIAGAGRTPLDRARLRARAASSASRRSSRRALACRGGAAGRAGAPGRLDGAGVVADCLADQARAAGDRRRELAAAVIAARVDLARGDAERAASASGLVLDRLPAALRDRSRAELEWLHREARARCGESSARRRPRRRSRRPPVEWSARAARSTTRCVVSIGSPAATYRCCCTARPGPARSWRRSGCTPSRRGASAPSSPSTARRCRRACFSPSCSVTLAARSPGPTATAPACSRPRTAASSSSTRSAICPAERRERCCACSRKARCRRVGESRARRVDVRVVAATHRRLDALVERGAFRHDLYYRLNVAVVRLPPLRERGDDVLLLARHFLSAHDGRLRLARDAEQLLLACAWPGNVRELRSVLQVAAAHARWRWLAPRPRSRAAGEPAGRRFVPRRARRGTETPARRGVVGGGWAARRSGAPARDHAAGDLVPGSSTRTRGS